MLAQRFFEMSQRQSSGVLRRDLGRLTQRSKCGANAALGVVKPFPNAIWRGIRKPAFQTLKGPEFIVTTDRMLQKRPQAVGCEEQAFDLVGHPNAEGSSAASRPISITAEDASGTHRFLALVLVVVATQKSVPNEVSNPLAMRASDRFQRGTSRLEFLQRTADPPTHNSLPPGTIQSEPLYGVHPQQNRHTNRRTKEAGQRQGTMSMTREAGCKVGAGGAECCMRGLARDAWGKTSAAGASLAKLRVQRTNGTGTTIR